MFFKGLLTILTISIGKGVFAAEKCEDYLFTVQKQGNYGAVNSKGNLKIPFRFQYLNTCDDELLGASEDGKKFGYVNKKGKIVIQPIFKEVGCFDGGLAVVKGGNEKYFLINKKGEVVSDKFEAIVEKSEGYYTALKANRIIYLDKNGAEACVSPSEATKEELLHSSADRRADRFAVLERYSFRGKYAIFRRNKKFGFINKKCEIKIKEKYYDASGFNSDGFAVASISKWQDGIIDINEKFMLKPDYYKIRDLNGKIFEIDEYYDRQYSLYDVGKNKYLVKKAPDNFKCSNEICIGKNGSGRLSAFNLNLEELFKYPEDARSAANFRDGYSAYFVPEYKPETDVIASKVGLVDFAGNVILKADHLRTRGDIYLKCGVIYIDQNGKVQLLNKEGKPIWTPWK